MITQPGVYDISAEEYHADPCPEPSLSATVAKLLGPPETPRHAHWKHPRLNRHFTPDEEQKFDIGKAAHALILNDALAFAVLDFKDYKKDAAKAERDAARAAGKIPLLADQFVRVHAMVVAARDQLLAHKDARGAFTNGKPEQTLIWQEDGIWCRARLDYRYDEGEHFENEFFDDYKTTEASADADVFSHRTIISVGHDVQAAFYLRGIKALGLAKNPKWRWIVQETYEPHALNVIAPMPGMIELADRKVSKAIATFRDCLAADHWPGHPNRTCYVDVPGYHETQYLEREVRDEEAQRSMVEKIVDGGFVP